MIKGMEHIPDVTSHMTRPMDIWWMVHHLTLTLTLRPKTLTLTLTLTLRP